MIPVWFEDKKQILEWCRGFGINYIKEVCIFCSTPTNTWHENTNNPVCVKCAKTRKVSDIKEDWGQRIRARKRKGTFDRGNSTRAN